MSQETNGDTEEYHKEREALLEEVVVENEHLIISTRALRQELDEHHAFLKTLVQVFEGFRSAFTALATHASGDYEFLVCGLANVNVCFQEELRRRAEDHKQAVLSPLRVPQDQPQQRGRKPPVTLTETIVFTSPRDGEAPLPPPQPLQSHKAAEYLFSQQPRKRWDYFVATERSLEELVKGIIDEFEQFAVREMTRGMC